MKHIRHYFCTALLGTAVLTACSGAEKVKSNTPVQITMWNYYNGAQKEEMDRLVQEFNDTVGLKQKIVVESVSKGSVSELEDAVRDSTDGKTGSDPLPDFCSAYADAAYDLWKKDKISDFRPYLTDEEYDSYISGYLEEGNFGTNAAMMIFPVAKSTEVLTLNSTAWEPFASETGASLEELSTWEGLAQTAKHIMNGPMQRRRHPMTARPSLGAIPSQIIFSLEVISSDIPFIPAKTEVYPWMWIRTRCAASGITSMCLTSAVIIWRRGDSAAMT